MRLWTRFLARRSGLAVLCRDLLCEKFEHGPERRSGRRRTVARNQRGRIAPKIEHEPGRFHPRLALRPRRPGRPLRRPGTPRGRLLAPRLGSRRGRPPEPCAWLRPRRAPRSARPSPRVLLGRGVSHSVDRERAPFAASRSGGSSVSSGRNPSGLRVEMSTTDARGAMADGSRGTRAASRLVSASSSAGDRRRAALVI